MIVPGLLPGAIAPPELMTTSLIVPVPARMPELLTVTEVVVPVTKSVPALTVVPPCGLVEL